MHFLEFAFHRALLSSPSAEAQEHARRHREAEGGGAGRGDEAGAVGQEQDEAGSRARHRADPLHRPEAPALRLPGDEQAQQEAGPAEDAQQHDPPPARPRAEAVGMVAVQAEAERREGGEAQAEVEGEDRGRHARARSGVGEKIGSRGRSARDGAR